MDEIKDENEEQVGETIKCGKCGNEKGLDEKCCELEDSTSCCKECCEKNEKEESGEKETPPATSADL